MGDALAQRPRLLIVDDEAPVRRALLRGLRDFDIEVVDVGTGAEALAAQSARPFDFALVDAALGGESGADVIRGLLQTHAETTAFVMSGDPFSPVADEAIDAGARGALRKPFDRAELLYALGLGPVR